MIAVDTSALMAILLGEREAGACMSAIARADGLVMSAATLAEALIVGSRRGLRAEMSRLVEGLGIEVTPVSPAMAIRAADAYRRWGKGVAPSALNFGDCFSYAVAEELGCALLFIGNDFSGTDIASAL